MANTIAIKRSPNYSRNSRKPMANNPCVLCGKEVTNVKHYVEMVDGGSSIAMPGTADVNDGGYMALQPIGADCLRKHPEYAPYAVPA